MGPVSYELDEGVAWVVINRPEAGNALNAEVRAGLWEVTHRFVADHEAKVLVLTGAGDRAFCAGADLVEMASTSLQVPPDDFLPHFGRNVAVPKPTIAAVNGAAYAGGFLLAQMCDLCFAVDGARFAISEAKVGRGAPWAAALPWLIPPRVALELLFTAAPIDAQRAFDIGLVNEVVAPAAFQDRVRQVALAIAANAPLSVRAAKEMVYRSVDLDAYRRADAIWEPVYTSQDAQEGPRAFAERRPPRWQGR